MSVRISILYYENDTFSSWLNIVSEERNTFNVYIIRNSTDV